MPPVRRPLRMGARRIGDPMQTLGDLRKGAPKGQYVGREIDDFRLCNFNESDDQIVAFVKSIGEFVPGQKKGEGYYKSNHLPFVFPYPTVGENLTVFNECYKGGVMIHRCTADERGLIVRALDPKTLKVTVSNGRDVVTGDPVYCDGKAIYAYQGKSGPVEVGCSPVVRMKIMIRGQGRIGTWDVLSTSGIDGEHLQQQLEMYYNSFASNPILQKNGLRGIPFILHRMPPVEVPYYDADGARKSSKHSFISVEIDPTFGALFMESTVRSALIAVGQQGQIAGMSSMPQLSAPSPEEDEDESILDNASGGFIPVDEDPFSGAEIGIEQQADPDEVATSVPSTEASQQDSKDVALPMSGQEFFDWHMKSGQWKDRPGNKYTVKDVNGALGCTVQAWVASNQGGYPAAARSVVAVLG